MTGDIVRRETSEQRSVPGVSGLLPRRQGGQPVWRQSPSPSTHEFGIALKRARRAAHLTQAQLAERAGFSVVYISMLERGARQPQRTTVALLADALALLPAERAALERAAQSPATDVTRPSARWRRSLGRRICPSEDSWERCRQGRWWDASASSP